MTQERLEEIEKKTRGQNQSPLWFKERKWRLTASNFGDILKATERRDLDKLCEHLLNPSKLTSPSIVHGKTYESIAIEKFTQTTATTVLKCGLFINADFPNFAASPGDF